jgi:hypothetical protein
VVVWREGFTKAEYPMLMGYRTSVAFTKTLGVAARHQLHQLPKPAMRSADVGESRPRKAATRKLLNSVVRKSIEL